MNSNNLLVVGAGFGGSVLARTLAEAGFNVHIIDKRNHIGGNYFDSLNDSGEQIHISVLHLFHGSSDSSAVKWLSRFTDWVPYEHHVRALIDDGRITTPLPVNEQTIEDIFGVSLDNEQDASSYLFCLQISCDIQFSDDVFKSSVGGRLANSFFRPYTRKMWGVDATEIEAAVGSRIPIRVNLDSRCFTDSFQALPLNGYTQCFNQILSHKRSTLSLDSSYNKSINPDYVHTFLLCPIDEFFDYELGELPHRSIKSEHRKQKQLLSASTINFTDEDIYTRMTQWTLLPTSPHPRTKDYTTTYEITCDPSDNNNEKYYPVRNAKSLNFYDNYKQLANDKLSNITFCGRAGLFQYLDMVPAINIHLKMAYDFIASASHEAP